MKISRSLLTITAIVILALILTLEIDFIVQINRRACASVDPVPKSIAFAVLRYQRAYHQEKGIFASDFERLKESFNPRQEFPSKENINIPEFWPDEEASRTWKVSVESQEEYTTVRVYPQGENLSSRAYVGVVSFNASEKQYSIFMCSTTQLERDLELRPLKKSTGKLVFKCPPGTREDC